MTRAPKPPESHAVTVALAVLILVVGGGFAYWNHARLSTPAPPVAATASPPQSRAPASAEARVQDEAAACAEKAPGPDTYVRTVDPGEDVTAEDTGGTWQWNYGKHECMSAVQYAISQAVPFGGDCVTVAYASGNPGYDVDSDPAPPLADVIASAGPGC
jgi:hypothetical protein